MHFHAWKRLLLSLAGMALVLCIGPPKAQAQLDVDPSFSSFTGATFGGYLFTIGGQPVTNFLNAENSLNLSAVNATNGDFQFGFTNGGSTGTFMTAQIGSQTLDITAIDAVYLVANGPQDGKDSVTATVSSSGAPITSYTGSAIAPPWSGGTAPGANFPAYGSGNFGQSNFLAMSKDSNWNSGSGAQNAQFGDYSFTNISAASTDTTGVFFGMHARWLNSNGTYSTCFLIFGPGAPVPEPAFFQLGGLLTLSGLGSALRLRKKRRTA